MSDKLRKLKNLSDKQLVDRVNSLYARGKNDDDEVSELFRRSKENGFKVIPKWDTYEIEYAKGGILRNHNENNLLRVAIGQSIMAKSPFDKNKPYFSEEDIKTLRDLHERLRNKNSYAKGGEIHGEVSVKDLDSTRVKDLMKKLNVKITSRKDIERAGEGFGQSTDIDYVVLKGNNKDLTIVGKALDLVDKDGKAWSDYAKGGEILSKEVFEWVEVYKRNNQEYYDNLNEQVEYEEEKIDLNNANDLPEVFFLEIREKLEEDGHSEEEIDNAIEEYFKKHYDEDEMFITKSYAKGGEISYNQEHKIIKLLEKILDTGVVENTNDIGAVEFSIEEGEFVIGVGVGGPTQYKIDPNYSFDIYNGYETIYSGKADTFNELLKEISKAAKKHKKSLLEKQVYAKGGKVKKGNEMIIGGLAGFLLGMFFVK